MKRMRKLDFFLQVLKDQFDGVGERTGYNYRYHHSLRVFKICKRFLNMTWLKKLEIDREALLAAAILHDIGKVIRINENREIVGSEDEGRPHDKVGGEIVGKLIGDFCDRKFVSKVAKIIRGHHGRNVTEIESKVIHDADILDNRGILALWRAISFSNHEKRSVADLIDFWRSTARERAIKKLDSFYFPEVAEMAKKRFKRLDRVCSELIEEWGVLDLK